MYTYENNVSELARWIRDEVEFATVVKVGKRGNAAKRVQEWLCLHGFPVEIDSDFGPATEFALKQFQNTKTLVADGVVGAVTFAVLVKPMTNVLKRIDPVDRSMSQVVAAVSRIHLVSHPREVGGENAGPWVRLYMKGYDGEPFPWCAGSLSVIVEQAAESLGVPSPINYTVSCDVLAKDAQDKGVFVKEAHVTPEKIPPGSIFLHRRRLNDWNHAGIVLDAGAIRYGTVEGNTNDNGSANGYELISRSRAYPDYDFIVFDQDVDVDVSPKEIVGNNNVNIRRHFFDEATFETYGSFFEHWGGWITAGHVTDASDDIAPPFAHGPLISWPVVSDGLLDALFPNPIDLQEINRLDAALFGCTIPAEQPAQLVENQRVTIHGFPAGSSFMSTRQGAVYLRGQFERKWIIEITSPNEPVTSGMSGGAVLDATTGEPVAIIVERNGKADIDGDQIPMEHSLRVITLHDVWRALSDGGGFV